MNLFETFDNPQWLKAHSSTLKNFYPETWTHIANWNPLPLLFRLKLLGVDYRTDADMNQIRVRMQTLRLVQVDGYLIRRSPP